MSTRPASIGIKRFALIGAVAGTAALAALGGCAYQGNGQGPGLDNPISRRSVWMSYLSGDDLRRACHAGAPDRLRLVYNAHWNDQVRVYELDGGAAPLLRQRVIGPMDLGHFSLSTAAEPLTGWLAQRPLSAAQYQAVAAAAAGAAQASPVPVDSTFASDSFYWVLSGCQQGHFLFNAWQYNAMGGDNSRYNALTFPARLAALDTTGIPLAWPHPMSGFDVANQLQDRQLRWYLRVYADHVGPADGI